MGKVDLPYLNLYRSGAKRFGYYRRDGLRKRIPGEPGSPEFLVAYQRIHDEHQRPPCRERAPAAHGSLAALIARYKQSPDWAALKPSSRQDYQKALGPLQANHGHCPVAGLERRHVRQLLEKYAAREEPDGDGGPPRRIPTPRRANKIVTVLSILMSYAIDIGWYRGANPALRPKKLKVGKWAPWSDQDVERFLSVAPPHMRRACLLAACTGQRGGDQAAMRWSAYDGAAIEVLPEKTSATAGSVSLWIPVHPALKAELDAADKTAVTILTREDGTPWPGSNDFQKAASAAIRAAGLRGLVWHGLRKTASRWLAEAGCAEREIMAVTGHRTASMVALYTEQADQKRRATSAMQKMVARWPGTSKERQVTSQGNAK